MGLNVNNAPKSTGGKEPQPPIEAGSYPARVVQIIDLGVQNQNDWKGKAKPPIHMLRTTYELVDEFCFKWDDDGQITEQLQMLEITNLSSPPPRFESWREHR